MLLLTDCYFQGHPVRPCGPSGIKLLLPLLLRVLAFPRYHGADQVMLYLPHRLSSHNVYYHYSAQFLSVFSFFCVLVLSGLKVDWEEEDNFLGNVISVPPEIYTQGCVLDVDDGMKVSILTKILILNTSNLSLKRLSPVKYILFSNVMLLCRGLNKLVIQFLSRPLKVEVERVSGK